MKSNAAGFGLAEAGQSARGPWRTVVPVDVATGLDEVAAELAPLLRRKPRPGLRRVGDRLLTLVGLSGRRNVPRFILGSLRGWQLLLGQRGRTGDQGQQ